MLFAVIIAVGALLAVVVAVIASRQRNRRMPVVTGPHEPDRTQPWQREAERLSATKPSQAQLGESPAQQAAPRTEDS